MPKLDVQLFRSAGYDAAGETGDIQLPMGGAVSVQIYEDAGTGSITSYTMQLFGSHDGTNYVQLGSDLTAEGAWEAFSPWPILRVKMSAKVMTGDAAIYASLCQERD